MRIGVVGCGYWGSKHVRVLEGLPEVEQVGVIDAQALRRESLKRSFPGVATYRTLDEALPSVDAVIIATPPESHAKLALQAIGAGKHVMVEKPLATSADDARQIVRAADAAGVKLMAGHTFEYNAAVWRLAEAVQTGELGNIHYIDTARLSLGLYQTDVNVVWDLAPHDISIVNHLLGASPDRVRAWGSAHAHCDLEDVAYLRMEYDALDVTVQVHVSWLDPCKVRRVTVVGSDKMAVYNDLADEERIKIYDKGVDAHIPSPEDELHKPPVTYREGGIYSPYVDFQEPLSIEDRHFVECILEDKTPLSDGANGLAVVEVLEAAQRSLLEGRPVALDEVRLPALVT